MHRRNYSNNLLKFSNLYNRLNTMNKRKVSQNKNILQEFTNKIKISQTAKMKYQQKIRKPEESTHSETSTEIKNKQSQKQSIKVKSKKQRVNFNYVREDNSKTLEILRYYTLFTILILSTL